MTTLIIKVFTNSDSIAFAAVDLDESLLADAKRLAQAFRIARVTNQYITRVTSWLGHATFYNYDDGDAAYVFQALIKKQESVHQFIVVEQGFSHFLHDLEESTTRTCSVSAIEWNGEVCIDWDDVEKFTDCHVTTDSIPVSLIERMVRGEFDRPVYRIEDLFEMEENHAD